MKFQQTTNTAMSWEELRDLTKDIEENRTNGPNNPHSTLRLFGKSEDELRITLYRDHHAWCPYCQKIWLWLECKRIPYKIKKVTMRCYGRKESWYTNKVPSGMLPALEIDGLLITESDLILQKLEQEFGPLGKDFNSPDSIALRKVERRLFQAWCQWLCNPIQTTSHNQSAKNKILFIFQEIEDQLKDSKGYWLLENSSNSQPNQELPGTIDIIFIPFLERINASLAYYKGFNLRKEYPNINNWFNCLEKLDVYRGTQGDFHTHAHDLPPQLGGCYLFPSSVQQEISTSINSGQGLGKFETSWEPESNSQVEKIALYRVIKHHEKLLRLNPLGPKDFDQPLRVALTNMITEDHCSPKKNTAAGLRYLRDRISVPRDMPLLSARKLRQSLEKSASMDSKKEGPALAIHNRLDQNPEPFFNSSS